MILTIDKYEYDDKKQHDSIRQIRDRQLINKYLNKHKLMRDKI